MPTIHITSFNADTTARMCFAPRRIESHISTHSERFEKSCSCTSRYRTWIFGFFDRQSPIVQVRHGCFPQIACPGDGDGNGVVDAQDVSNYTAINASWGLSSAYDFNFDGVTDAHDLQIINDNMGACPR